MFVKKKKSSVIFLVAVLTVVLYSTPCFAQGKEALTENDYITQQDIDPRIPVWTSIVTTSGTVVIPANTYVPGASSYYVRLIQSTLNAIGYNCGTADGIYGTNTRNAIIRFQNDMKLTADGIVGEDTWKDAAAKVQNLGIKVPFQK